MKEIYINISKSVKRIMGERKKISQLVLLLAIGHKAVGTVSMAEILL